MWLFDGCCLVQPRVDPSSAMAGTYESVLSGLVIINQLITAAGEDNPAGEGEEDAGSPALRSCHM